MEGLEKVKERLYESKASLVVEYKDGKINEYYSPRVQDIVSILKQNKNGLKDTVIADKVVGKVVASLAIIAGVKKIYADTISRFAIEVLEQNDIEYEYKTAVDYIMNSKKDGMCPMENKFKDETNLKKVYEYFVK